MGDHSWASQSKATGQGLTVKALLPEKTAVSGDDVQVRVELLKITKGMNCGDGAFGKTQANTRGRNRHT